MIFICILLYLTILSIISNEIQAYCWLPKEAAQWAIDDFEKLEVNRTIEGYRGTDRRSAAPFISGNGFRSFCHHVCDESNSCRMTPESVKNGECIFVKSDLFEFFAKEVTKRIPINNKYIIVSHNGDLSTPDGQDDARLGMPRYITSDILENEYMNGRLIAHHGQNLWWKNISHNKVKPETFHCLPIGFENRQYPVGKHLHVYVDALKRNVINRIDYTLEEETKKPLILVAFYPKSRIPDRLKVLKAIGAIPPQGQPKLLNPFYNETDLSHIEWLDSINQHRFVLAPFGKYIFSFHSVFIHFYVFFIYFTLKKILFYRIFI